MAQAYNLTHNDSNPFLRANTMNYDALASCMDSVAMRVEVAGGACDERAFLAAFYGAAV